MQNLTVLLTATNDADGICETQSPGAAGALLINGLLASGGVASWGQGQKISIVSGGNDTNKTFTITGPDPDGTVISEVLAGASGGAATSVNWYKGVSSIVISAASASTVAVGILVANGAVSKSLRVNGEQPDFKLGAFVDVVSGTLTYSAQYTYMQPEDTYAVSYANSADWRGIDGLSSLSVDGQSNAAYKVNACRLRFSAFTSGSARLTITQSY